MKLLIAGGDARAAYAAAEANRRALDVSAFGLENSPLDFPRAQPEDFSQADAVLMANPWRTPFPGPLGAPCDWEGLIARLRPDAHLILPDALQKPASFARSFRCLSDEESYLLPNARLTAEGALSVLLQRAAFSLQGARALIIGYGRIGSVLAQMLEALGCRVRICARRAQTRRLARQNGLGAQDFDLLGDTLPDCELIVNTVPHAVLNEALLSRISRRAVLIDVASAPYGFSLEQALALGLDASRENNLPGRVCPQTAGRIQLETFLSLISSS